MAVRFKQTSRANITLSRFTCTDSDPAAQAPDYTAGVSEDGQELSPGRQNRPRSCFTETWHFLHVPQSSHLQHRGRIITWEGCCPQGALGSNPSPASRDLSKSRHRFLGYGTVRLMGLLQRRMHSVRHVSSTSRVCGLPAARHRTRGVGKRVREHSPEQHRRARAPHVTFLAILHLVHCDPLVSATGNSGFFT